MGENNFKFDSEPAPPDIDNQEQVMAEIQKIFKPDQEFHMPDLVRALNLSLTGGNKNRIKFTLLAMVNNKRLRVVKRAHINMYFYKR